MGGQKIGVFDWNLVWLLGELNELLTPGKTVWLRNYERPRPDTSLVLF